MGGTRFVGKSLVQKLISQNHDIDIFTRGNNPNPSGSNLIERACCESDFLGNKMLPRKQ